MCILLEIWLLLQQISQGFYTIALLVGVCEIRPPLMVQNAPLLITPMLIGLRWLPVAAHIEFKSLTLTSWLLTSLLPLAWTMLFEPVLPLLRCAQHISIAWQSCVQPLQSTIFSYLAPPWCNGIRSSVWAGAALSSFKKPLNHSSSLTEFNKFNECSFYSLLTQYL